MGQIGDVPNGQVFPDHADIVSRLRSGNDPAPALYGLGLARAVGSVGWDCGLWVCVECGEYEYFWCFE